MADDRQILRQLAFETTALRAAIEALTGRVDRLEQQHHQEDNR